MLKDDHCLVVDKPSALLSVPGKPPLHMDSLLQRVQQFYPNAEVVHRLDMGTSGVLIFALNKWAQKQLHAQFRERLIQKDYIALVQGCPKHHCGSIELALSADWPNRPKQRVDFMAGKASLTHWRVLHRYQHRSAYTKLSLKPMTGRSHQLRVHLKSIGHPILGDVLYHPQPDCVIEFGLSPRLYLHADTIRFYHPMTEQLVKVTACSPF